MSPTTVTRFEPGRLTRLYRADRVAFEPRATRVAKSARPEMRLEGRDPVFRTREARTGVDDGGGR